MIIPFGHLSDPADLDQVEAEPLGRAEVAVDSDLYWAAAMSMSPC